MGGTAVLTAAFLFSFGLSALALAFFTVRRMQGRVDSFRLEIAAGFIRFKFSANQPADLDDPEVIDAPSAKELPLQNARAAQPAPEQQATAVEGGGAK